MADSKISTKHFLSTRGIPVPKLFATIRDYEELERFDFGTLPDSFVLKPNAGFGGEGILVITGKQDGFWEKMNNEVATPDDLFDQVQDILDGKFSIVSLPDIAFFEQKINSIKFIPDLVVSGLPDVRVVVHNLVPVMAMLRVPTPESDGKANVHLGGLGIGIDLTKGETTHATQYNKLIDKLPGDISTSGHQIPHWNEILKIASEAQLHTNLGYLAADIAIDEKDGPVLIEVNARAGLMVQIANLAPLKKRLERIKGLKVESPEKGIALGQELFGKAVKKKKPAPTKTIVNYIEPAEILAEDTVHRVRAELDPTHETTAVDRKLAEKLNLPNVEKHGDSVHLKLRIADKRIQTVAKLTDLSSADYKIILGRRDLTGFLIDPTLQSEKNLPKTNPQPAKSQFDYQIIDQNLMAIDREVKLLHHLKPTNLAEEKEKFFTKSGDYDPVFYYHRLKFDAVKLRSSLNELKFPETPLGNILREKEVEITRKIDLLSSIGKEDFSVRSIALYGAPDDITVSNAREFIRTMPEKFPITKKKLNTEEAVKEFQKALRRYGLKWKIIIKVELATDALTNKDSTIFIRAGSVWTPERLRGTIAHEIETHVLRAENGRKQPYEIFSRGLANYLLTEEGLAIHNQERVMPQENEKCYWPALNLLSVEYAKEHSFSEVFRYVKNFGFDDERAWKTALKVKRGLNKTAEPGSFTKEHLYFSGYQKIKKFIADGGDVRELYVGKIKLEDLHLIAKMPEIKPPKYLPEFYE